MVKIFTGNYRYNGPDRLDITVKGQDDLGRHFAPTWDMVMGVKKGTMSEDEYVQKYCQIIDKAPVSILKRLFEFADKHGSITLVCFCQEYAFCHRNILARILVDRVHTAVHGGYRS